MDNISVLKKEERLEIQYEIINIETSPNNELKKYIRNEIENITKKISDIMNKLKNLLIKQMLLTILLLLVVEYWLE